jgi:hypothetical protein
VAASLVPRQDCGGLGGADLGPLGARTQPRGASSQTNFTASSDSIGVSLSAAELMDLCLAENERHMAGYDSRLLRPTTVPFFIRLARRFMRPKPAR